MSASSVTPSEDVFTSFEPRAVDVLAIEQELDSLWRPETGQDQDQVTRACMSNLVVFARGDRQANTVVDELATIARHHPSRVLLLVAEEVDVELEAYVSASCHLGGGGRQICSEHVRVRAGGQDARRLSSVARPLLIGDLPTTLWWLPPEPPDDAAPLEELYRMSDEIVYDSSSWTLADLLATAAELGHDGSGIRTSDIAWIRLEPWRRLLAQTLDPSVAPGALTSLRAITVRHPGNASAAASLLLGWLLSRLDAEPTTAAGDTAQVRIDDADVTARIIGAASGENGSEIESLTVEWGYERRRAHFAYAGRERLAVYLDDRSDPLRLLSCRALERAELVAASLSDLGFDSEYRAAVAMCRRAIAPK